MKSLLRKEFKEISLWSGIGSVLLVAAMALFLFQALTIGDTVTWGQTAGTVFDSYRNWMMVGAPLIALALGLIQIVPELARDHWAFLIHRPATIRQIWTAKAATGVIAYLCSTLVSLFIMTSWMCAPGHFPGPFDFHIAGQGLLSILAGLPFYFAAQLVTLRQARWYGSRLLPLVTAGALTFLADSMPWVVVDIGVAILGTVLLAVAARGSFCTRGEYEGQTIGEHFSLGGVMAIAGATSLIFVVSVCYTMVQSVVAPNKHISVRMSEQVAVSSTGKIVLVDMRDDLQQVSQYDNVMDLDGNSVPGASLNPSDYHTLSDIGYPQYDPGFAQYSHYYIDLGSGQFYSPRDRCLYIYSPDIYKFQGYMGSDGVLTYAPKLVTPFTGKSLIASSYSSPPAKKYLSFSNAVFVLETSDEPVFRVVLRKIITANDSDPFVSVTQFNSTESGETIDNKNLYIAAGGKLNVSFYRSDGTLIGAEAVPSEPLRRGGWPHTYAVYVEAKSAKIVVAGVAFAYGFDPAKQNLPLAGLVATQDGNFINIRQTRPDTSKPSLPNLEQLWPTVLMSPMMAGLIVASSPMFEGPPPHSPNDAATIFQIDRLVQQWTAIGAVPALILIFFTSIRYGAKGKELGLWVILWLGLGVVGVLMMLAMNPMPVTLACPSCGKHRNVAAKNCEHCGAAFTKAEPDGREIFEGISSAAHELATVA